MRTFARGDKFPSYIVNVEQDYLKGLVTNFTLTIGSSTTLQVVASADDGQVSIAIQDLWRYNTTTITKSHPGGAAGTYDVFVTAAANVVVNTPATDTDNTNYAFALAILPAASTPTIVPGTVDVYRKVGACVWNGTSITSVSQIVGFDTSNLITKAPPSAAANTIQPTVVGTTPLTLKGLSGQTADLLSVQNFSAGSLFTVSAAGNTAIAGTLGVTGATTLASLSVTGAATVGAALSVTGAAALNGGSTTTTAAPGTNTTAIATTAYVQNAISSLSGGAGGIAFLGNDPQTFTGANTFSKSGTALTVTNNAQIGGTLTAGGTMTANTGYYANPVAGGTPALWTNQIAAQWVVYNRLLTTDANQAFSILGTGFHAWGVGGATAPDTGLGRESAGLLAVRDGANSVYTSLKLLNLTATGSGAVTGNWAVSGQLQALGAGTSLAVTTNATIGGTLAVTSNATVGGTLGVTGLVTTGTSGISFSGGTGRIKGTAGNELSIRNAGDTGNGDLVTADLSSTNISCSTLSAGSGISVATGDGTFSGTISVTGTATMSTINVSGVLTLSAVGTALSVAHNATISGTLGVTGASTLGTVTSGNHSITGTLGVSGASTLAALSATTGTFSSTLGVTGAATLSAGLTVSGGSTSVVGLTASSTIAASGTISANAPSGSGLNVTANAVIGGTLGVTGLTTLNSLSVTNGATIGSGASTVSIAGATGTVGFFGAAGGAKSTSWGSAFGPGGSYKTALTSSSTLNNVIDYVMTMKETLRAYGLVFT